MRPRSQDQVSIFRESRIYLDIRRNGREDTRGPRVDARISIEYETNNTPDRLDDCMDGDIALLDFCSFGIHLVHQNCEDD